VTEPFHVARRRGLFTFFLAAMMLVAALVAPAALAQETEAEPSAAPAELLMIDTTGDPYVVLRTAEEPSVVDIAIAGVSVDAGTPVALASSDIPVQTIILIDNSSESTEFLESFIAVAVDYVRRAPVSEQIEVWTSGGGARLRVGFNNDHERNGEIITNILTASGGNKLWDGVRGSVLNMVDPVPGAANVLILTANTDNDSTSIAGEARGTILNANASVFLLHGGETISEEEQHLTEVSLAGSYAAPDDKDKLAGYGALMSEFVASTWKVEFPREATELGHTIDVTIDDFMISAIFSSNARASGSALVPVALLGPTTLPGLGFLDGNTGRSVGLVLGAVAAALCAYSFAILFQKETSGLDAMLGAYADPNSQKLEEDESGNGFTKSLFLKRAVEITEGIAERRGALERSEAMLERADLSLRAGEAMTAYAGMVLASFAIGLVLIGGIPGLAVMGLMGILLPPFIVRFVAARRGKKFVSQLPDTLGLLASTLKAGYSFMQGVEAVSQEIEDPMGSELRRIVTEAQLGRPLVDAMDASAERMDSTDFAWAVMAVKIQREVGGNLSELLLTVAETMTERERLRRDVATLTAEGKMSAIVLGLLPIGLGFAMWAMNPAYINTLFTDSLGKTLLGASIVAAIIGFAWMKKIINIEI
jgi:tight adherence protein B